MFGTYVIQIKTHSQLIRTLIANKPLELIDISPLRTYRSENLIFNHLNTLTLIITLKIQTKRFLYFTVQKMRHLLGINRTKTFVMIMLTKLLAGSKLATTDETLEKNLVHENLHVHKSCIHISGHSVRDHPCKGDQGLGSIPQRLEISLPTAVLTPKTSARRSRF